MKNLIGAFFLGSFVNIFPLFDYSEATLFSVYTHIHICIFTCRVNVKLENDGLRLGEILEDTIIDWISTDWFE